MYGYKVFVLSSERFRATETALTAEASTASAKATTATTATLTTTAHLTTDTVLLGLEHPEQLLRGEEG